ncbi:hypothetical protein A2U01_0088642, partial [Trifolium medium]|nr:hypothetical protein [Trifolium medium]
CIEVFQLEEDNAGSIEEGSTAVSNKRGEVEDLQCQTWTVFAWDE